MGPWLIGATVIGADVAGATLVGHTPHDAPVALQMIFQVSWLSRQAVSSVNPLHMAIEVPSLQVSLQSTSQGPGATGDAVTGAGLEHEPQVNPERHKVPQNSGRVQ